MSHSDAILDRLMSLHPKVIDLSLDRMHRLLAALGNPERRIPPVIHIAGTNGKGSTCAFADSVLRAAGLVDDQREQRRRDLRMMEQRLDSLQDEQQRDM